MSPIHTQTPRKYVQIVKIILKT